MERWINADAVNKALDRIREEVWLHDIPSPTVPEYIEHHDAIQKIMLVIDKERKLLNDAASIAVIPDGWDLFDTITSAWHGKRYYFLEDDGRVYSRQSHKTMAVDDAISEFLMTIGDQDV